jgi:hypothetical protein
VGVGGRCVLVTCVCGAKTVSGEWGSTDRCHVSGGTCFAGSAILHHLFLLLFLLLLMLFFRVRGLGAYVCGAVVLHRHPVLLVLNIFLLLLLGRNDCRWGSRRAQLNTR